jgi:hypothetical protein
MSDAAAFDALTAKVNELAQICADLSQENAELRSQLARVPVPTTSTPRHALTASGGTDSSGSVRLSRRAAGMALAGAAAGVVGVAVLADVHGRDAALASRAGAISELADVEHEQPRVAAATSAGSVIDASLASSAGVVIGSNTSTGAGVEGTSSGGRGGVFSGGAAQLQLSGGKSTHPKSGERGDLYADSTGRLWFCTKSGSRATWKQIA